MKPSAAQIRDFHIHGFLAVQTPIASDSELEWLRGVYDRMFEARSGRETGDQFDLAGTDEEGRPAALPQILDPAKYAPELNEGRFLVEARELVQGLLGEGSDLSIGHAILKPAGIGAPTPWHQDEAYWDPSKSYCSVSAWMPLQPATLENGCLWFVPGSHRWPVLRHQSIGGDSRIHGLEIADGFDEALGVAAPIPAGGLTIHLNRTAHYAGPNETNEPRRALIMMGGLPAGPYPADRTFPWNEVKATARSERAEMAKQS